MTASNRCRRCGAQITWAKTVAGKAMPLDLGAHTDGNVYLDDAGRAVVLGREDPQRTLECHVLLMPHWATCTGPGAPK